MDREELKNKGMEPFIPKSKNASAYTDVSGIEFTADENFQVMSLGRMVAKRFFRSKLSMVGLAMIIFVFLFSFLGPVIVDMTWGYGETQVFNIERKSTLVSTANFKGPDGKNYNYYDQSDSIITFKAPPSADHWLGTDTSGFGRVRQADVRRTDFTDHFVPRHFS